ncbi:4-alpha-glucanotransferase [soil metagenome]
MLSRRSSGVLLHVTSLPGRYGMGEIGAEAHRWLDTLHEMGQKVWQILPLNPTGHGNSPYSAISTFAGNELLIGFDQLIRDGLLSPSDINCMPTATFNDDAVEFAPVTEVRRAALAQAAVQFKSQIGSSPSLADHFNAFCLREQSWLDDYALYRALKSHFQGVSWDAWPDDYAMRRPETLAEAMAGLHDEIETIKILQFLFDSQWSRVRAKAAALGIAIVGDVPIFVAHDSSDTWANPSLFHLDAHRQPTVVAGVPPDYFSATGQLWGNPLYDWDKHRASDYAWWTARLKRILSQVDVVRIDHFRGFEAYWEIGADEPTAINGTWRPGPGDDFFEAMRRNIGENLPIIAEDLGLITDEVRALRDRFRLPGMRVLQFAFGTDALAEEYLPENYVENCVAYTGTHDNDTTVGLFWSEEGEGTTRTQEQIEAERHTIRSYFHTDGTDIHWTFIDAVLRSRANLAIFPLQDLLGLGSDARMNIPGVAENNWSWRFRWDVLTPALKQRIATLTSESGR